MKSADYVESYTSDKGTFRNQEKSSSFTHIFKGKTQDGRIVRLTISKDEFWGVILADEQQIVIRQTRDYTKNEKDESLIIFDNSDLIKEADDKSSDVFEDALVVPKNNALAIPKENALISQMELIPCTYYLLIATDADFEFYQGRGSSLTNCYNYIYSVLNIIEGVYESTFNLRFILTFQHVYASSNNPYTSTDASTLLDQFKSEWNNNRGSVNRDIAHLFTGKLLNSNGVAYMGQISNSSAYSLSRERLEMYQTTAHEIGHNLNANHPTASNCLCGSTVASVMCSGRKDNNLWFCDFSISEISPFLWNNRTLLNGNLTDYKTLAGGTINSFQEHIARVQISSSQNIIGGYTVYKAPTIVLSPGFNVAYGSNLWATNYDDCGVTTNMSELQPENESESMKEEVADNDDLDFDIYPNPNDGNFTVKLSGEIQPYTLEILSIYGGVFGSFKGNEDTVNFNRLNLPTGIYLVKITMADKIAVKKFIVKK
jgi:hypothetical protein